MKLEKSPTVAEGIKQVCVEIVDDEGLVIQSYHVPIETSGGEEVMSMIPSIIRMRRKGNGDFEAL